MRQRDRSVRGPRLSSAAQLAYVNTSAIPQSSGLSCVGFVATDQSVRNPLTLLFVVDRFQMLPESAQN